MDLKKDLNTKSYANKKHHEKYDKRHKLAKQDRKQQQLDFGSMSAEQLLDFIEEKYSELSKDVNIHKANFAIKQRIDQLIKGYNKEQYMKRCIFFAKSEQVTIPVDEIYEKYTKGTFSYNKLCDCKFKYLYVDGNRFIQITRQHHSADRCQTQTFIDSDFSEGRVDEIDFKRMKVTSTELLNDFIKYKHTMDTSLASLN